MMKRLFCVVNNRGKKQKLTSNEYYTDDKMFAKTIRDELGGLEQGFCVSRGQDHIGKHSGFKVPMMRRQPKEKKS